MKQLLIIIFVIIGINSVQAEVLPRSSTTDPHVKTVTYDPNQVYKVTGMQGYTTAIKFSADEKIVSVNIGDSSAWLANVQDNVVNLKPVTSHPETNMNVVTSRGTYQFFLTAPPLHQDPHGKMIREPTPQTVFLLRFHYPQDKMPAHMEAPNQNRVTNGRYTVYGSRALSPIAVYDDGRFTYFDFGNNKNIPAIFLVDSKGNESIVNYHMQNRLVVAETISNQFTLRIGGQTASVFNEAAR